MNKIDRMVGMYVSNISHKNLLGSHANNISAINRGFQYIGSGNLGHNKKKKKRLLIPNGLNTVGSM